MALLQVPHQRDVTPTTTQRFYRNRWWQLLLMCIVAIGVLAILRDYNPLKPREIAWWEGIHTNSEGKPLPRLQLTRAAKSQVTGQLEIPFNPGFDIQLPVLNVSVSVQHVIFAVEDPSSLLEPRRLKWYVLHKTGEQTSTLYQLDLRYSSSQAGKMVPTNFDNHHVRIAPMTSKTASVSGR
jgi:hypothetical protein